MPISLSLSHPLSRPAQNSIWEKKLSFWSNLNCETLSKKSCILLSRKPQCISSSVLRKEREAKFCAGAGSYPPCPGCSWGWTGTAEGRTWPELWIQNWKPTSTQHSPHRSLDSKKMFAWRGNCIPSSKSSSSFFSKGQGRKQRGDGAAEPLLGFYQKQTDVIIRLQSLL